MRITTPREPLLPSVAGLGVLAFACLVACGSNSLVIGGDPEQQALQSAGGSAGSSGTAASGDAGSTTILGSGGSAGDSASAGSAGTLAATPDPYPWVLWAQGSVSACPEGPSGRSSICWNFDAEGSRACEDDGDPYCNACSCRISCEVGSDCPSARNGQSADCVGSDALGRSCFVLCAEDGACPSGMTCAPHPDFAREVCVWLTDDETWHGIPR